MAEEAHLSGGADQPLWGPTLEHAQHDRRARDGEQKGEGCGDDEGNDLILGHCRNAGADGEQRAGHQPTAEIAGEDHAVVGSSKEIDRDPEREGQGECYSGKAPGGEEFSDHCLGHADRQSQKQLDRAALALLRPQPHRQRRNQDEIEPGMKGEKGLQVGLPALEEIAEEEGQHPRHDEKDHDEHIGERGGEIARELAAKDGRDVAHRNQAAAAAIGAGSAGTVVISRKTSSSRPRSTRRPVTSQPWARARSVIWVTMARPGSAKIISASPSPSLTGSTAATPGKRIRSARTRGSVAATPRRTALWWRERSASSAGGPSARIRPWAMMIARLHTASTSSSR